MVLLSDNRTLRAYQNAIAQKCMGLAVGNSVAIGYSDNAQILNPGVAVAEWSMSGSVTGSWSDSTQMSTVIGVQAMALAQTTKTGFLKVTWSV